MVIWMIKIFGTVRRAVAGRKHPHQMAWAVAFGLLLGVIPHGNLLAFFLLMLVLSLKLNHAMAGLTAMTVTFVATHLDPVSHRVGTAVLSDPSLQPLAANMWQLPLVPWTNLNNTVVMGSFVIGVGALLPVFGITYPLFRWLAPSTDPENEEDDDRTSPAAAVKPSDVHEVVVVDQGHRQVARPHRVSRPRDSEPKERERSAEEIDFRPVSPTRSDRRRVAERQAPKGGVRQPRLEAGDSTVNASHLDPVESADANSGREIAVETRIDVIRITDYRDAGGSVAATEEHPHGEQQEPMDEALNYLLRQLRDSQQRKVA